MSNSFYAIEALLDKRVNGEKIEYFVKWKYFGEEQCTWETSDNLKINNQYLIDMFEKEHPYKIRKKIKKITKPKQKYNNEGDTFEDINEERIPSFNRSRPKGVIGEDRIEKIEELIWNEKNAFFDISWKERANGIKPSNSIYSVVELEKYEPVKLAEFYNEHIVFVKY